MKFLRSVLYALFLFPAFVLAQGEAVIPFLQLPPSPSLNSMGCVGTSLPGADVYSFYYNPAHLAATENMGNISFQFFPEKTDWMGSLTGHSVKLNSTAATLGWNFKNLIHGFPFRLGLGYMNSSMNYGRQLYVPVASQGDNIDEYSAFGAGIGFEYYLTFQLGLTYKDIKSSWLARPDWTSSLAVSYKVYTIKTSAVDYGILITAPITKLLNQPFDFKYSENHSASPFLNVSLGYDLRNIGDEVSYNMPWQNPLQKEPIGRTAVLGYSFNAGINAELEENLNITILKFDWAVEAEDLLIKERPESFTGRSFEYQNGIGDIDFGRNLIQLKSSKDVIVRKGMRLEAGETISISSGAFDGRGYRNIKTSGIGLRTKGLFKFLRNQGKVLAFLADHADIRYFSCSYFDGSGYETELKSVSINLNGIENIF